MASILYVPVIFSMATLWLYGLTHWGVKVISDAKDELYFPSNLEDLQKISTILNNIYQENFIFVLVIFSSAYLYKQTFAIPGSALLNLLAGAIFGLWHGFPIVAILTACGASLCYILTKYCAQDQIIKFFPQKFNYLKEKVTENQNRLPYFLLFLRIFPMSPNWFLNMTSPIVGIPLPLFFITVLIGLMPYNLITVQTGVILSQLKSIDDVFTLGTFLKLAGIAALALLPGIFVKTKTKTS